MKKELRVGILVNNKKEVAAWEATMIRTIGEMPRIGIVAFISCEPSIVKRKRLGLRVFEIFENSWFGSSRDAFKKAGVFENDICWIDISKIEELKKMELDIIYRTGGSVIKAGIESLAKNGLWYHSFGKNEDEQVAFWEVMRDEPAIGSTLFVKQSNQEPIAVYEGSTNTVPFSVKNSRNSIGWRSSSYLVYRLYELLMLGQEDFFSKYKNRTFLIAAKKYAEPRTLKVAGLFFRNIFRYLRHKISGIFFRKKFTILYSQRSFDLKSFDLSKFKSLELPTHCFWADPFIIEKNKKSYVFFEEFDYKKERAHISMIELDEQGQQGKPVTVLEKPYHLSYPFLFEDEEQLYMVPETAEQNTVELYRCQHFPDKWEFVRYLLKDAELIDATILFHEGKWWMFGTKAEPSFTSTNDQLFLYWSESLSSGDWKPHPQNPVATHISNCRPAGKIFSRNGKLYRPAQNNASKIYGYAIRINEIEVLNEFEYKEKLVDEILPDGKRLVGVHTINFTDKFTVIDGIQ